VAKRVRQLENFEALADRLERRSLCGIHFAVNPSERVRRRYYKRNGEALLAIGTIRLGRFSARLGGGMHARLRCRTGATLRYAALRFALEMRDLEQAKAAATMQKWQEAGFSGACSS
jgi:hypothetical protein